MMSEFLLIPYFKIGSWVGSEVERSVLGLERVGVWRGTGLSGSFPMHCPA